MQEAPSALLVSERTAIPHRHIPTTSRCEAQIVGEHAQRHLGGNLRQRFHQEVRRPHPHLERAEGMRDRFAARAHGLGIFIEPLLRRFENGLVLPSRYTAALGSFRAFKRALRAGIRPISPQRFAIFLVRITISELFPGRASPSPAL